MDETKEARFPKIVSEQLYAVANGRGRGRGNTKGVDQARTWHTVLLSSGESPAVSFTQDGGTRTRVLEVRGSPFGTADEATRRLVDDLRAGILRSYGWAGPMFVQWLMRHRDQWPAFADQYKSLVAEFAQSMPGPEAGRLAHYAAAINLAATLAHAALSFPWDFKRPLEGGLWEDLALEAVELSSSWRRS